MKYKNTISLLVLLIVIFSLGVSAYGVFSNQGQGEHEFESVHGQKVLLYGKGIYQNDSVTVVAQGKAQDIVTVVVGIPLLLISLYFSRKGSLKGRLLLTGTLGYFLYTYVSYTFLWMYNPLFLAYVVLMSASFFSFTLSMVSFDMDDLSSAFSQKLPVKFIGGFQIFIAAAIGLLWLGMIGSSVTNGSVPAGLEHYTTLVIQGMDLGFLVPTAFISGTLIIKRKSLGFLLSSIIIMKSITMGTALSAMIIGQAYAGVQMSLVEITIFPVFNVVAIFAAFLLLKNISEKGITVKV